MPEIEDRLAAVPAQDLPAVDLAEIRGRVRKRRGRQRAAVVLSLVAAMVGTAFGAASLLSGVGTELADTAPTPNVRLGSWTLADPSDVTSEATAFEILVEQPEGGCGATFSVHDPLVALETDRIVISAAGDYTPPEPDVVHTCEGTVGTALVELSKPIGDRVLVDAHDNGVRWRPSVDGDPATWVLAAPDEVTPRSTVLELSVTRIECASSFTGKVLEPVVTYGEDEVLIRAEVERHKGGGLCPSNPWESFTLTLTEPVGDRVLVDAICREDPYSSQSHCVSGEELYEDGVRWVP